MKSFITIPPMESLKNFLRKRYSQAFTLLELIIVITILAILATIAFVSFQEYSSQSRDTQRTANLKNIDSALELFHTKSLLYPAPENAQTLTFSGGNVWTQ